MEAYKEIIQNINQKYVLVKDNNELGYLIIDKIHRHMVIIENEDKSINTKDLIQEMIKRGVEVYDSEKDLPPPIEPKTGKWW